MPQLFSNNARALLVSALGNNPATDTTITIESSKADFFPVCNTGTAAVPAATDWCKLTLQDSSGNIEIVYARSRTFGSGVFSNVIRAQEGTTIRSFASGSICGLRLTSADLAPLGPLANATSAALIRTAIDVFNTTAVTAAIAASVTALIPSGTRMPFAQAAAPTGWTQDVSDNATNRMLRVVNTAGNGIGGTASPILNNVVPAHTHGFTTGTVSSDHTHGVSDPSHQHNMSYSDSTAGDGGNVGTVEFIKSWGSGQANNIVTSPATTGISLGGISSNHTHSGSTDNGSSQTNWAPRYIDMIICSKN